MCDFETWSEWMSSLRDTIYYLDVDTRKYQDRLINPTPLDCVKGYIMEDVVGDRDSNNLTEKSMNLTYVRILN